jgi:hypothetical protein
MKSKHLLWCLWLLPVMVLAQTNTVPVPTPGPSPNSGLGLILTLIPLLVPMLVAAAKTAISKLPTWTLPILSAVLGAVINWVSGLAGGPTTTLINGALLGAAGTGIREIFDQVKGQIKPENTTPEPPKP